jgi:TolB-like protein
VRTWRACTTPKRLPRSAPRRFGRTVRGECRKSGPARLQGASRQAANHHLHSDSGEQQRLIKTLPRKGVRFVAEVREEQAQTRAAVAHIAVESPRALFSLPDRPFIAVLPFANMSGDSEQDYFADGMADEIITALSRCAGLFMIARNSSFTYRGRSVDVRQVGRELGVRYVLEGSVRRSSNRLRFIGNSSTPQQGYISGPSAYASPSDYVAPTVRWGTGDSFATTPPQAPDR